MAVDPWIILRKIDGRGYKAYQELMGRALDLGEGIVARPLRIQSDPFAPPSIIEFNAPFPRAREHLASCSNCVKPLEDFLYRRLHTELRKNSWRAGEGHSGELSVPRPGPIVIKRRALLLDVGRQALTVLVRLGLPSRRRRVLAREALETFRKASLALKRALDTGVPHVEKALREHLELWRAQQAIRRWMSRNRVFSFIAEGSILPRKCGGCEEPLENAVPFDPPPSLSVEVDTGTGLGAVRGMALPRGLTLVLGPAFHGKTTLAEAIAQGVWDHVGGDGRELVLTDRETVVVQSENRRHASCVDLTPWFSSLPGHGSVECFNTADASGSTSMAATIMEFLELGASGFVIDEDTSASNFIHRDKLVERLVGAKTLISLSENAPRLKKAGKSLLIVATGVEDLAPHADVILIMHEYRPQDVTESVKRLYGEQPPGGGDESYSVFPHPRERVLEKTPSIEKPKLRGRNAEAKGLEDPIDLRPLWQLEEESQLATVVALGLGELDRYRGRRVREVSESLSRVPLDKNAPANPSLVEVRPVDVGFVINRVPGLVASRAVGRG